MDQMVEEAKHESAKRIRIVEEGGREESAFGDKNHCLAIDGWAAISSRSVP
jgi:hypothetical protein